MRPIRLTMILFFFAAESLTIVGQTDCKDAFHPTDYRASILNCCIRDIIDGNIVVYLKDGALAEIEALAVNYRGKYYNLSNSKQLSSLQRQFHKRFPDGIYMNENYEYNRKLYSQATSKMAFGTAIAVLGAGLVTGGIIIMERKIQDYPDTDVNGSGFVTLIAGMGALGNGIPIAIIGGVNRRKYKNTMLKYERTAKLTIGNTSNSIGLVIKF